MTAHFKPPVNARRPRNAWSTARRPANVLQFRKQRFYHAWREWWPLAALPLVAFVAVLAWPITAPKTGAVPGPAAATPASAPWAGHRTAAELDAEQPASASPAATVSRGDRLTGTFAACGGGARFTCVVDGDTFWYRGTKIRIADINAPEVSSPRCASEAALGAQATHRLVALLNAGSFQLEPIDRDTDRYGRSLRIVTRGGTSLGETMVEEGLAERWQGYRRSWC